MRVIRSVAPPFLALAVMVLAAACGGTSDTAQPPAQAEIVEHMHEHLEQVEEVRQAVVRGDLEAARAAGKAFADHQALQGMPETVRPVMDDMVQAAHQVGTAENLAAAGDATAAMVSACGSCHRAMAATPGFPATPPAERPANETVAKMLEHRDAVEMLYHGLIAPSDELWKKGAQALKASSLKTDTFPMDVGLAREALDAQDKAHEAAERAVDAKAPWQRANIYGELIGDCASCHALTGRVLGPGLPAK